MTRINDKLITDPTDELYDLQSKYNVKISRSNSSDAVYIFRKRSYIIRIGHVINKESGHLMNFKKNEVVKGKVSKTIVEDIIKAYLDKL